MKKYTKDFPATIGQAIYTYGDANIRDIVLYLEKDGEHGIIITKDTMYCNMLSVVHIALNQIEHIQLKQERNKDDQLVIIAEGVHHLFNEDIPELIETLTSLTGKEVEYDRNLFDTIYFNAKMILEDIRDDLYEDTVLNDTQNKQLQDYLETIDHAKTLDETNYRLEMELLVDQVMQLVEELELDSEEIDQLEEASRKMHEQEDQMFDQVKDMYANNKDTIKSMTGIDVDDLKNKSPDELNGMLDDLCNRFNISKDQLASLAAKFGNRH